MLTRLSDCDEDRRIGYGSNDGWDGRRAETLAELIRRPFMSGWTLIIENDSRTYYITPSIVQRCNTVAWTSIDKPVMFVDKVTVMRDNPDSRSRCTSIGVDGRYAINKLTQYIILNDSTVVKIKDRHRVYAQYDGKTMPMTIEPFENWLYRSFYF